MSQMDAMSIQPLVHSLHLWYYPPCVTDVCTDFKLAACGYAKCLDTLIPTKGFKHMLDKQDNQRADEGMSIFFQSVLAIAHKVPSDGCRAKKEKSIVAQMPGPSNSRELQ